MADALRDALLPKLISGKMRVKDARQYIVDNPARWAFDRENHNAGEPGREDAWRV